MGKSGQRLSLWASFCALPIIITLGSSNLFAGSRHKDLYGHHDGERMAKILDQLNLEKDQKLRIQKVHDANKAEVTKLRGALETTRGRFEEGVHAVQVKEEDLTKLHEEMLAAKIAMLRAKFKQMLEIRALLTDEQKAKFQSLLKHRRRDGRGE